MAVNCVLVLFSCAAIEPDDLPTAARQNHSCWLSASEPDSYLLLCETSVLVEVHLLEGLHGARSPGHGEHLHLEDHGGVGRHRI